MFELAVLLALAATSHVAGCAYPAELPPYRLCEAAPWRALRPLVSTAQDVRSVLGKPTDERDLASYLEPYPGDERARAPVLRFDGGPDWEILVYFVRTDPRARGLYPEALHDRVLSIDLVPRHRTPFGHVRFSDAFGKSHTIAPGAAWDEYRHPSGLVYEVYTSSTPDGDTVPGDLNRISYGVSNEAAKAILGDRSNHGMQRSGYPRLPPSRLSASRGPGR